MSAAVASMGTVGLGMCSIPGAQIVGGVVLAAAAVVLAVETYEEWEDYQNSLEEKKEEDRLRSSDAKKREKKQIDDAFGKDRAKREKESKDLHDDKKGGGNDRNKKFKDLKKYKTNNNGNPNNNNNQNNGKSEGDKSSDE